MPPTSEQMVDLSLKLHLSRQTSERLAQRAADAGKDVAELAAEMIEQEVSSLAPDGKSYEQWSADFDSWMTSLDDREYPPGFILDDSRESIYEGRGE